MQNLLERERITTNIVSDLNYFTELPQTLKAILIQLQKYTQIEAIGIRLEKDGDYPYFLYSGFPESFILHENSLCAKDQNGIRMLDIKSNCFALECMCGNIIRQRFDPKLPFFTNGGSFWSNNTTQLLATTSEEDRQARTRNYCNSCDYESVALIPIKDGTQVIGLIQFNDKRINRFTPDLIEFFEIIGIHIGLAIKNNLLYSNLEESHRKLQYERDRIFKKSFDHMWEGMAYCQMIFDENNAPIDWIYLYVNESFGKITGLYHTQGMKVTELIGNIRKDHPDLFLRYGKVASTGIADQFELFFKPLNMWLKISVFCPEKGYFIALFDNISRQKENELQLEDLVRQRTVEYEKEKKNAEMANRAKTEFLMNMSHELRTPLNAIMGFSEILKEKIIGEINPEQDDVLDEIIQAGYYLSNLISDLIDLSRIETGKIQLEKTWVNLSQICEHAIQMIQNKIEMQNLNIKLVIPNHLSKIFIDERRIFQVILNLLSNAIKYTPSGGKIGIEITESPHSVQIKVWDTGIGIDQEDIPKLFQLFERLESKISKNIQGIGIGLNYSKKLVELHHGKIWVESELGKGSQFYVSLPRDDVND